MVHEIPGRVEGQRPQTDEADLRAVDSGQKRCLADSFRCGRPTGCENLSLSDVTGETEDHFKAAKITLGIIDQYHRRQPTQFVQSISVEDLSACLDHDRSLRLRHGDQAQHIQDHPGFPETTWTADDDDLGHRTSFQGRA
jgi:hypothetical protein